MAVIDERHARKVARIAGEQLFLDLAVYGMCQRGPVNSYRLVEEQLERR
jgi:hypothetical protein